MGSIVEVVSQTAFEKVVDVNNPNIIRDLGHDGTTLSNFINHEVSKAANLTEAEIVALRLHTGPLKYCYYKSIIPNNTFNRNGLIMTLLAPAFIKMSLSDSKALPVTPIIGFV